MSGLSSRITFGSNSLILTRRQDNPTHGEVSIDPLDNRPRVLPAESVIDLIAVPDKAGGAAAKAR